MPRRTVIAVIGPGSPDAEGSLAAAETCGRLVAGAGATLVTGGLGGVMAAASRGAKAAGGNVVAVLPGTDAGAATEHADLALCTGVGEARDLAVVASADAVIAVGGGWGTLAEIGLARKVGRPVVLLRSWRIEPPDGQGRAPGCFRAETPEQAVALALWAGREGPADAYRLHTHRGTPAASSPSPPVAATLADDAPLGVRTASAHRSRSLDPPTEAAP